MYMHMACMTDVAMILSGCVHASLGRLAHVAGMAMLMEGSSDQSHCGDSAIYTASIVVSHYPNHTTEAAAMGKRVASIMPMMFWLVALLLVAGLSVGSGDDMGAIRLPSAAAASGEGFSIVASSARPGDNKERPWKCCDTQVCTMSALPSCWCHDLVEQCSKACKECAQVRGSNPPRYVCKDMYRGEPAPRCARKNQAVVHGGPKEMAVIVRGSSKEATNGEEMPWKCCDKAVITGPTTEGTVVWYCMDKVEHCTCDRCLELEGSHRYYCLDGYEGSDPGPSGARA